MIHFTLPISTFGIHLEPGCESHGQNTHFHTCSKCPNTSDSFSLFLADFLLIDAEAISCRLTTRRLPLLTPCIVVLSKSMPYLYNTARESCPFLAHPLSSLIASAQRQRKTLLFRIPVFTVPLVYHTTKISYNVPMKYSQRERERAVSYTHLTLPTRRTV